MLEMKIYAEVSTVASLTAKLASGDVNGALLFGADGDHGLIIPTSLSDLRTSMDGTKVLMKTRSGQADRITGIPDALAVLTTRADEEGLTYTLYSDVPCHLDDGLYTPLADPTDWAGSVLPDIAVLTASEDYTEDV
jgi:hypothetical protein